MGWVQRYRTSGAILGQSFRLLAREWRVWPFAAIEALGYVLFFGAFYTALFGTGLGELVAHNRVLSILIMVPLFYPVMLLASMMNTAIAFVLHESLAGRYVPLRVAWWQAQRRLGLLARYNVIAALVAGTIGLVGVALDKARLIPGLGRLAGYAGGLAWAAASFFVIPLMAVTRPSGAFDAVRHSARLARSQWGKAVAGVVTIALAMAVPLIGFMVLGMLAVFGLAIAVPTFPFEVAMLAFFVLVGVATFGMIVVGSMAQTAYQVGLYRYAVAGAISPPFTKATLVDAWAPYRR